jgi:formate dehydrogenase
MNGGHRTHWNANTIQRDPAWRKGKGPHCALWMSPADATAAGLADGELARVETRAGAAELPVHVDPGLRAGHVLVPNGFGMEYPDADGRLVRGGVAVNELTEAGERDPFTGCPHHKMIRCRVSRARS